MTNTEQQKLPADPKWRNRRWQTFHETRDDYIRHLLDNITDCKVLIMHYDELAKQHIDLSDEALEVLKTEKELLAEYQEELRKVIQG